jgi:hypothetical protein
MSLSLVKNSMSAEVVSAKFKITCNINGTDESVICQGIRIDNEHLVMLDDDGIVVSQYGNKGSHIETGEDFPCKAYLHLFLNALPSEAFDLKQLANMSFIDFIYRLIEVGKE